MFQLFKHNKEPLNTTGYYCENRDVVPERGHASGAVPPKGNKRALFGSTKDIEKVIECINEAKKDGAIVLFLDELMFDTNVNTLEIVVKSLGYRCTTAKLAFEGEQVSERLIIIIEGDSHEDQKHTNRQ